MNNCQANYIERRVRKYRINGQERAIPPKSENDRRHIVAAVFSECDIIVSWNFHHMVNVKTIDGVRIVCVANNIKPIDIYAPSVLLERSYTDE